jgi:hypothetical protein
LMYLIDIIYLTSKLVNREYSLRETK